MKTTTYGQKDGTGPTAGLKAAIYQIVLPDGRTIKKRTFRITAPTAVATAFTHDGKIHAVVWSDTPAWEGDFGRLTATRVSP